MSYAKPTSAEVEANEALQSALKALLRTSELWEQAGYGSLVLGPLADAQHVTNYALDTALGRT